MLSRDDVKLTWARRKRKFLQDHIPSHISEGFFMSATTCLQLNLLYVAVSRDNIGATVSLLSAFMARPVPFSFNLVSRLVRNNKFPRIYTNSHIFVRNYKDKDRGR